jgi:hypothetical protein
LNCHDGKSSLLVSAILGSTSDQLTLKGPVTYGLVILKHGLILDRNQVDTLIELSFVIRTLHSIGTDETRPVALCVITNDTLQFESLNCLSCFMPICNRITFRLVSYGIVFRVEATKRISACLTSGRRAPARLSAWHGHNCSSKAIQLVQLAHHVSGQGHNYPPG